MVKVVNIDMELQDCISELDTPQKEALLNFIKAFQHTDDEMRPQTIEEYNADIEESEAEIERGEFYTHEEVMAIITKKINDKKRA